MIKNENTVKNWKQKFADMGVDVSDFDSNIKWISKKGLFRYEKLASHLSNAIASNNKISTNKVEMPNFKQLDKLYLADLIIRRELFRVIAPIEINMRTSILGVYYSSGSCDARTMVENICKEIENHISKQPKKEQKNIRLSRDICYLLDQLAKVEAKNKRNGIDLIYFDEFIDNIEMKVLVIIFNFLNTLKYDLSEWFDGVVSDFVIKNILNFVKVRNAVSHHNIFFKNQNLSSMHTSDILQITLKVIDELFGKNNEAIISFKRNWMSKYNEHNLKSIETYLDLVYKCDLFNPSV